MLEELKQAAERLCHSGPGLSAAAKCLARLHEYYEYLLSRVRGSRQHPRVMRILAEEAVEKAEALLEPAGIGGNGDSLNCPLFWEAYLSAVQSGELLDTDLERYRKARVLADAFAEHSYLSEICGADYKSQRYAYALSNIALPEWFRPEEACEWLEEIVTAFCFLWFAVLDYAQECGNGIRWEAALC